MQVEVVFLFCPGLEVLRLLLPLQNLKLRLPHGLLPLPLQAQLFYLYEHKKGFPGVILVSQCIQYTFEVVYNTTVSG